MSDAIVKAVVGLRGYGKSSHVVNLTADAPRVLYYDTLGNDYSAGIVCREWEVLTRFWRRTYRGRFRISYKPVDPMVDLDRLCELSFACGDMVLVIDEIQLYFRGPWCEPALTKVITAGRHAGVELIGVTQAPKKLGELLRSQATWWDVFRTVEGSHRDYILDRLPGVDPVQLQALQRFDYLHYEDGADCYWLCRDPFEGQPGRRERIDYAQNPSARSVANPG